ncbi:histone acetyltransferase [Perilla frutescens var. hirtella]|nr:histone acetyltransferase [Perilla frutescens var. hirtella]
MPRPGPRPYECVRRAWHSDRHHPIRGSLIQEVFRIVNEVHCSATRKNREWQEKLPIVVLKAEEIMYSKANSEAEYSDLQTLRDRVNDAINTIIRRDESSETGEFLHPCIEAALHLGCTPRRSSRSQRNDSPRSYLRPENLEGGSVADSNLNAQVCGNLAKISPLILHCPTFETTNPLPSCSKAHDRSFQSRNPSHVKRFLMLQKNFVPSDNHHHASAETPASSDQWSVFPVYYSDQLCPDGSKLNSSRDSFSNPHPMEIDALNARCPSNRELTSENEQKVECDLTLRLGSVVVPRASIENSWSLQVENGGRGTLDRIKFENHHNK